MLVLLYVRLQLSLAALLFSRPGKRVNQKLLLLSDRYEACRAERALASDNSSPFGYLARASTSRLSRTVSAKKLVMKRFTRAIGSNGKGGHEYRGEESRSRSNQRREWGLPQINGELMSREPSDQGGDNHMQQVDVWRRVELQRRS